MDGLERFLYEYDFTAGWQIEVRVERVIQAEPHENHRIPVCIAGRRAGPPDGCGGPQAYAERRRDAVGWGMADDVDVVVAVLRRVSDGDATVLHDPEERSDFERAVSRLKAREPILTEGFSPALSNAALRRAFMGSSGYPMIRMAIQVVLVDEASDRRDVHEIVRIDRGQLCPEALGLSLEEAKAITGGIQQVLAGAQVAEWHADQRACPDCGRRRSLKGRHQIVFRTPFGALRLDSERFRTCRCAKRPTGSTSPLAELLRERVSPEMLYLETKFASLVSYGLTVGLLGELLPLERPIGAERVRRHLFRVAEAHEAELASAPTRITLDKRPSASNAPPDGPLFVGIDGGYVRGRDKAWFEVIAGKSLVSFHRDGRVPDPSGRCFAFVQTVDDQPRARLVDTLRQQGMQPQQQVIFLSYGADTLRRLQQNIAPEAEHVLDWFHVAMRLTVLGQMIKSARTEAATAGAKAAALERFKWLLWHGNAPDAVDDIECLVDDVTAALEDNPTSASLRKLAAALGEFATYIVNNAGHIVNYGERFRAGERISTGFVESAINQVVDKRFDKRQSMRWTPRGAHQLLQTRTRVLYNDLDQVIRRCYPAFRRSQDTDIAPVLSWLLALGARHRTGKKARLAARSRNIGQVIVDRRRSGCSSAATVMPRATSFVLNYRCGSLPAASF
jgi:hypothetical protein